MCRVAIGTYSICRVVHNKHGTTTVCPREGQREERDGKEGEEGEEGKEGEEGEVEGEEEEGEEATCI